MWLVALFNKNNRVRFSLREYLRILSPNLRILFPGMQEPAETGSCTRGKSYLDYFQLVYWAVPASVQPSFCLRTPAERLTSEAGNGRKPQVAL